MDPAMRVAVVSAVIGAVGTVAGAWIQTRPRRPRADQQLPAGTGHTADSNVPGVGQAAGRDSSPDDSR